jgi:hypothetical protein
MLVRGRVIAAFEAKKDRFAYYQRDLRDHASRFEAALEQLVTLKSAEIEARLAAAGVEWPGARPTHEHDRAGGPVIPFGLRWHDHAAARGWAIQVLRDQTTFAVDGSQIPSSRDFSVPVAAVQVGWFENPHTSDRPYVKDVTFDVLAPDELAPNAAADMPGDESTGGAVFPDAVVNLRRFQGECRAIEDYIRSHARAYPAPLCLFDGSLVVSFARHMRPPLRQAYLDAVAGMLIASQDTRVPLVGYVDTSYAHDLTMLLVHTCDLPAPAHLTDGGLLRPHMQWGDRSPAWWCARDDGVLSLYDTRAGRIAFVYLKTTSGGPPARLELPAWLLDDDREMERVLDLVRAECVVGTGYPYAAETADAVAVLSAEDRQRFYATFQQFAEKEGLAMRYARKAQSKVTRR